MFNWIKKLVGASNATDQVPDQPRPQPTDNLRETIHIVSVWSVVDRFLTNNPTPTPYGVQALVDAGAVNLLDSEELLQACEKIQEHGYQHPINPTLMNELSQTELLEFVRWHGQYAIEKEYYANEMTIRELIERFRIG
ncbi:MAG: hypothetical protein KDB00_20520 [Planctomycetales bacterium]|nr:hypothetical protein [Planctomycetales bacterium]